MQTFHAATFSGAENKMFQTFMGTCTKVVLVVVVLLGVASCRGQRTADGECYYTGKGFLQILGAIGDAAGDYVDTQLEVHYQQEQIELQRLREELKSFDPEDLERQIRTATAFNDLSTLYSLESEIRSWNRKIERHEYLEGSIADYQEEQKKKLARGPQRSFSQIVDESGECD